jgi:hypothetical protein
MAFGSLSMLVVVSTLGVGVKCTRKIALWHFWAEKGGNFKSNFKSFERFGVITIGKKTHPTTIPLGMITFRAVVGNLGS